MTPTTHDDLSRALAVVATFAPDHVAAMVGVGPDRVRELERVYGRRLPAGLERYLATAVPATPLVFERGGNPICLLTAERLGPIQPGYSHHGRTGESLDGWSPSWFVLGYAGGDPIVVDLDDDRGEVLQYEHGAGSWDGLDIAGSIPQLLLCSAALDHALMAFEPEAVIDDERGYNLAPKAAAWLFPHMRGWAGGYYDAWCSLFDNA